MTDFEASPIETHAKSEKNDFWAISELVNGIDSPDQHNKIDFDGVWVAKMAILMGFGWQKWLF